MTQPQVINTARDKVLIFDAEGVIDNTTQAILNASTVDFPTIKVDIIFVDMTDTGSSNSASNLTMTYVQVGSEYVGWWSVDIADVLDQIFLIDRHKYVATVRAHSGDTSNMREFKVHEFTVDNDQFEDTMMRLPYQVEITGFNAYIRWYASTSFTPGGALFEAAAYQDGVGNTFATRADKVTHRGPIIKI